MSAEVVDLGPHLPEIRFVCEVCDTKVFSCAPSDSRPVCASCRFLERIPDEKARARLARYIEGMRP